MTYPLEASNLIAYLRAFSVATADPESNDTARIIRPLQLGRNKDELNKHYLSNLRPESPPIPYDLRSQASATLISSDSKRATSKTHSKKRSSVGDINAKNKERSKSVVSNPKEAETEHSDSSVKTIGISQLNLPASLPSPHFLLPEETKTQKVKRKNPLAKLFHKSDKTSINSDSSTTYSLRRHSKVGSLRSIASRGSIGSKASSASKTSLVSSTSKSSIETDNRDLKFYEAEPHMPNFTIDSSSSLEPHGFTEPSTANTYQNSLGVPNGNITSASASDDVQGSEGSSTDSAFTDIEGDSLMGSDMIYDYSVPGSFVLQEAKNLQRQKANMKKEYSSASLFSSVQKSGAEDDSESKVDKPRVRKQVNCLKFEKIYHALDKEQAPSNLSRMIKSKFRSTFVNPLNFYGFVGSEAPVPNSRKVYIDFFIPPNDKPTIKKLEVWNSTPVHELIGYVLLQLSNMEEYKDALNKEFINPNNWRMELIDEDGELYDGNFGVLDRTRQLSSYNSPNCLALCRVTKAAEVKNNEKQTPLPSDFRQNLDSFGELPETSGKPTETFKPQFDTEPNQMGADTIEVKVGDIPDTHTNVVSFFISSNMTVGQLLDLICQQYHIDPLRYRLAKTDFQDRQSSLLGDTVKKPRASWLQPLDNTIMLSALPTSDFKFVPNLSQTVRPLTDIKVDSFREAAITPSMSTFISRGITPPTKQLEQGTESSSIRPAEPRQRSSSDTKINKSDSRKTLHDELDVVALVNKASKLSFGDIVNQSRPSLPVSLNTIYFKWKVYRKKPPILNRIEKSLIIDGDYIHLAPTDDVNWHSNFADNSLSTSNNLSHHHYLHHYNYSKFYKETMMKTSSFHITQIVKLKQYAQSKNPTHFKIVIEKATTEGGKDTIVKKKYDLEAETITQCEEIVEKIRWTLQVYNNMIEK